jgi:hypothetical protein
MSASFITPQFKELVIQFFAVFFQIYSVLEADYLLKTAV